MGFDKKQDELIHREKRTMNPEQVMQEIEKHFERQREEMVQDLRKAYRRVKFPDETHHIYFEFDYAGDMCYSISGWIRGTNDDFAIYDKNKNGIVN
jgi:hypothetical protein